MLQLFKVTPVKVKYVEPLRGKLLSNRVLKFGVVGVFATLTYYFSAISLKEILHGFSILVTNLIAYGIAMIVSYVGHYFWTYKAQSDHGTTIVKYVISALFGSALNSTIVYICMRLRSEEHTSELQSL